MSFEKQLLERVTEQYELLKAQAAEIAKLRSTVQAIQEDSSSGRSGVVLQELDNKRKAAVEAWQDIKDYHIFNELPDHLLNPYLCTKDDPRSVEHIVSPAREQPWNTAAYRFSYVKLSTFLDHGLA